MALGDFLARLGGRGEQAAPEPDAPLPGPPTAQALREALAETERLVDGGSVPSPVTARVRRITATVRDTIPRLDTFGAGSDKAYAVMATATDYLPEAVGGYLRLPRRFADTRPVDGPKTALMVLVDQLDLLGATMDQVFDAVCRDDANALVTHGRFLAEKFGAASRGGELEVQGIAVPPPPGVGEAQPMAVGNARSSSEQPSPGQSRSEQSQPEASPTEEPRSAESESEESQLAGSQPAQSQPEQSPATRSSEQEPHVNPLRPPSSLDL